MNRKNTRCITGIGCKKSFSFLMHSQRGRQKPDDMSCLHGKEGIKKSIPQEVSACKKKAARRGNVIKLEVRMKSDL